MMLQFLRRHIDVPPSLSLKKSDDENNFSNFSGLETLFSTYGRDYPALETLLIKTAEYNLSEARYRILVAKISFDFEAVHNLLDKLADAAHTFGTEQVGDEISFAICTLHGMAYSGCGDSIKAIKSLNNAIKCCPCSPSNIEGGGNHLPGLSEALVLLSEAYSTLGKDKDAIHSARLAVECAHKRLVTTTTSSTAISSESKQQEKLLRHCRPLLDRLPALLVTYLTLATMLERIGTEAQQLALEWYTRVITTASKMMHERVIDESIVERRDPEENLEMVYNQINEISVSAQEAKFRLQREPSKTSHNNNLLRPESDTGIGAEGTIKGRRREDHLYDDSDIQLNLSERGNEHFSEDNGWNDSGYIGGRQTHTEGNHVINDKGVIHHSTSEQQWHQEDHYDPSHIPPYNEEGPQEDYNYQSTSQQQHQHPMLSASMTLTPTYDNTSISLKPLPPTLKTRPQSALPRLLSDYTSEKPLVRSQPLSIRFADDNRDHDDNDRDRIEEEPINMATSNHLENKINMGYNFSTSYPQQRQNHYLSPQLHASHSPNPRNHPNFKYQQQKPQQQQQQQYNSMEKNQDSHYYIGNGSNNDDTNYNNQLFDEREGDQELDQELRRREAHDRHHQNKSLSRNQSDISYVSTTSSTLRKRGRRRNYNMFIPSIRGEKGREQQKERKDSSKGRRRELDGGRVETLRREMETFKSEAAVTIQRVGRVYIARSLLRAMRRQRDFEFKRIKRRKAAVFIQRVIRGHQSRNNMHSSFMDLNGLDQQRYTYPMSGTPNKPMLASMKENRLATAEKARQYSGANKLSLSLLLRRERDAALKSAFSSSHNLLEEGRVLVAEAQRMMEREAKGAVLEEAMRSRQELLERQLAAAMSATQRVRADAERNREESEVRSLEESRERGKLMRRLQDVEQSVIKAGLFIEGVQVSVVVVQGDEVYSKGVEVLLKGVILKCWADSTFDIQYGPPVDSSSSIDIYSRLAPTESDGHFDTYTDDGNESDHGTLAVIDCVERIIATLEKREEEIIIKGKLITVERYVPISRLQLLLPLRDTSTNSQRSSFSTEIVSTTIAKNNDNSNFYLVKLLSDGWTEFGTAEGQPCFYHPESSTFSWKILSSSAHLLKMQGNKDKNLFHHKVVPASLQEPPLSDSRALSIIPSLYPHSIHDPKHNSRLSLSREGSSKKPLRAKESSTSSRTTTGGGGKVRIDIGSDIKEMQKKPLAVGARVEGQYLAARLGKKSSWLEGSVMKVHHSGSYDLLYDNGTRELELCAQNVRVKEIATNVEIRSPKRLLSATKRGPELEARSSRTRAAVDSASAASVRCSNKEDMERHMVDVLSFLTKERAQSHLLEGNERERKVLIIQALARGYVDRHRHRGLLLSIGRRVALKRREDGVRSREKLVWERFAGLVLGAEVEITSHQNGQQHRPDDNITLNTLSPCLLEEDHGQEQDKLFCLSDSSEKLLNPHSFPLDADKKVVDKIIEEKGRMARAVSFMTTSGKIARAISLITSSPSKSVHGTDAFPLNNALEAEIPGIAPDETVNHRSEEINTTIALGKDKEKESVVKIEIEESKVSQPASPSRWPTRFLSRLRGGSATTSRQ